MRQFLGKLTITIALVAQAYFLFSEPTVISHFNKNLKALDQHELLKHEVIPPIVKVYLHQALEQTLYARYTVVGLLASVALFFLTKVSLFVVFPLLGLILQTLVQSNPLLEKDELTKISFLKNVAIYGALLVWASNSCGSKTAKKQKTQ